MNANTTTVNGTANGSDQTALAGSYVRAYLFLQNKSTTSVLYVNYGAAASASAGFILGPGSAMEYISPQFVPQGDLHVLGVNGEKWVVLHS